MFRAATLSITILSLTAFVGCEKKPSTPPEDAADGGGDAAAEGGDAPAEGGGEGEEAKPEEDAKGGW